VRRSGGLLVALGAALVLGLGAGCKVLNAPLLAVHGVTGMHHKTRAVDIAPFYSPGGKLGWSEAGLLTVEREPGVPVRIPDDSMGATWMKADDPIVTPDGGWLVFVSGRDMVTSGGAHNDHVWQVYAMRPDGSDLRRISFSHRKESMTAADPDGRTVAFARRTEFRPYALDEPAWGLADVFVAPLAGGAERSLTGPRFEEVRGVAYLEDAVVFGATGDGEAWAVWRAPLEGGEPELWLEGAWLPATAGGGWPLVYAERGTGALMCVAGPDEPPERLGPAHPTLTRVAVSSDGTRVATCRREKDAHETFALYELDLAGGEEREVARVLARNPRLFKPFDYVKPVVPDR
jgi:hypothetical protein